MREFLAGRSCVLISGIICNGEGLPSEIISD